MKKIYNLQAMNTTLSLIWIRIGPVFPENENWIAFPKHMD